MAGETSLTTLLRSMSPQLNAGEYVFCTLRDGQLPSGLEIVGSFREQEGLTVILERSHAEQAGFSFDYVAAWITLNVHSALEAVGLTAAFATRTGQGRDQLQRDRRLLPRSFVCRSGRCRTRHASAARSRSQRGVIVMWQSYVNGLLVALGLIMAIGTQNAFVLAQSLRREHHLPVAALCVVCDALLVAAGVFGLATVSGAEPDTAGDRPLGRRVVSDLVRQPGAAPGVLETEPGSGRKPDRALAARGDAQRAGGDAAQPARLSGHGVADRLARRAADRCRALMSWARRVRRCCGFSPWRSVLHGWRRGWHGRVPGGFSIWWWR